MSNLTAGIRAELSEPGWQTGGALARVLVAVEDGRGDGTLRG